MLRTTEYVLALLQRRLAAHGGRQADLARELGVSTQTLSMILTGARPPGGKVLKRLGLRRARAYEDVA